MILFTLWPKSSAPELQPDIVAERLRHLYQPLLQDLPAVEVRSGATAHLAVISIPLHGWNSPTFQEDEERWALVLDHPLNARTVLRQRGVPYNDDNVLLVLSRELEQKPRALLSELAPPFAMIWMDKRSGEFTLQCDALGQAQLFEHQKLPGAVTNKITNFATLGLELSANTEDWATRISTGWFLQDRSGYDDIRRTRPGQQYRWGINGFQAEQHDVLRDWVHPQPMSRQECLEHAEEGLREMIEEGTSLWDKASVGLSGGWDSRAIVAMMRHYSDRYELRVRGLPHRFDVMIANQLARIAELKLRIKPDGGLPPDTVEGCRESMQKALLWQAGYIPTPKHRSFLVKKPFLQDGMVNVMGSHSGFGKGDFAVKINAYNTPEKLWEDRLARSITSKLPVFMKRDLQDVVIDNCRKAYRDADSYGIEGLHRFTFFFMHEYTRRWASGSLATEVNLTIAPFLTPKYIQACFAYPAEEIKDRPFHKYITQKYAPDWADYPYEDQADLDPKIGDSIPRVVLPEYKVPRQEDLPKWKIPPNNTKKYHYRQYWREVGKPILKDAYKGRATEFCLRLFDPDRIRDDWRQCPDGVALAQMLPGVLADIQKRMARVNPRSSESPSSTGG